MKSHFMTAFAAAGIIGLLFLAVRFGGLTSLSTIVDNQNPNTVQSSDLMGAQAPYFDLPNLAGDHVKVGDFAGTPLVVVFWSTWNDAAANQMHILDQYLSAQDTSQKLVKVVAIDSQEERSIVNSFMIRGGYSVPTLIDASGASSEAYHIKSLPTTYFLSADGIIREVYVGVLSEKVLVDKIEQIIQ